MRIDLDQVRGYLADHPHEVLPVERGMLEQVLHELTAARDAAAQAATPALGHRAPGTPR